MASEQGTIIENLKNQQLTGDNGVIYWMARDIMATLQYAKWDDFREVIRRAEISCEMAGHNPINHFASQPQMVAIGSGAMRGREDMALSRYACYLIAMNGDTGKWQVAEAQAYFVEKTYLQERAEVLTTEQRRVVLRDRVKDANKKLGETAQNCGVRSAMFGVFHDAGYKGLYGGLNSRAIKLKKGIGEKDSLLDCIGPTELAANEFRATQADDKLIRDGVKGEKNAIDTHYDVGAEVRRAIENLGGTMPEHLSSEPSIKKLKSPQKQIGGEKKLK